MTEQYAVFHYSIYKELWYWQSVYASENRQESKFHEYKSRHLQEREKTKLMEGEQG